MKQRISYTLRLTKLIDASGSAIEVKNYLVNKSTKHVLSVAGFIQASDCKIQGLFKDFLKTLLLFSRAENL